MAEKEYIEREYVLKCMEDSYKNAGISAEAKAKMTRWLNKAPAADVVPVVRSRWREREDRYYGWNVWECMNCHEEFILEEGTPVDNEYKFCPNCGAKMEG
jgi:rubrerythrin